MTAPGRQHWFGRKLQRHTWTLLNRRVSKRPKKSNRQLWSQSPSRKWIARRSGENRRKSRLGIFIIDVDEVDSADQSFAASVYFQAQWKNAFLRHKGPGPLNRQLSDVWNPRLTIIGQQMAWKSYPDSVEIQPDGTVICRQKVWGRFPNPWTCGTFRSIRENIALFRCRIYGRTRQTVPLLTKAGRSSGIADRFSLPDFDVVSWEAASTPYYPGRETNGIAGYEMQIYID